MTEEPEPYYSDAYLGAICNALHIEVAGLTAIQRVLIQNTFNSIYRRGFRDGQDSD